LLATRGYGLLNPAALPHTPFQETRTTAFDRRFFAFGETAPFSAACAAKPQKLHCLRFARDLGLRRSEPGRGCVKTPLI
jgi:hypothetical protein